MVGEIPMEASPTTHVRQVHSRVLLPWQLGFADLIPPQSSWKYDRKM